MTYSQRGGGADVLTLPRLMRSLHDRAETPNADKDPIRYQWHTRPFQQQQQQQQQQAADATGDRPASFGRFDSDDILAAVRRRIRSPPDHRIRDAMHRRAVAEANPGGGRGGQLNSVMAHYLTASSLADSVLNRRLMQPAQQPGCSCCAGVNFANKLRRHRAARGVVPLPEQDRLAGPPSSFHYDASPDELAELADHRRLRHRPTTPPELRRSEAEHQLDANLRRLESSILALGSRRSGRACRPTAR
ncbi:hypothetical protein BOX15_Mlig022519g1 [Macrostomum lignano]|uniref:Uncharacterized protein n=1 Tax=Macrostomum lignano TaxID=282301 RepID=A0A267FW32_9PLAT|nr:hypothetical protein BOX15_Mlig022519g1 [Macrostomum lignano]